MKLNKIFELVLKNELNGFDALYNGERIGVTKDGESFIDLNSGEVLNKNDIDLLLLTVGEVKNELEKDGVINVIDFKTGILYYFDEGEEVNIPESEYIVVG